MKKNNMDLLNGSLWDKILMFALPLAASNILQQFFNSADMAVVGQFSGKAALAAVGSNNSSINKCNYCTIHRGWKPRKGIKGGTHCNHSFCTLRNFGYDSRHYSCPPDFRAYGLTR